jgi:hypothetical protein
MTLYDQFIYIVILRIAYFKKKKTHERSQ